MFDTKTEIIPQPVVSGTTVILPCGRCRSRGGVWDTAFSGSYGPLKWFDCPVCNGLGFLRRSIEDISTK